MTWPLRSLSLVYSLQLWETPMGFLRRRDFIGCELRITSNGDISFIIIFLEVINFKKVSAWPPCEISLILFILSGHTWKLTIVAARWKVYAKVKLWKESKQKFLWINSIVNWHFAGLKMSAGDTSNSSSKVLI